MEDDERRLWFEKQLIERAKTGDSEAGKEILKSVIRCIDGRRFDSPLFPFLAECLHEYERGVPIDRALCIEQVASVGGRPAKYNPVEIAALDILLRRELGFQLEQSLDWIEAHVGMGKKEIRKVRKQYDAGFHDQVDEELKLSESLDTEILVHNLGKLRARIVPLLETEFTSRGLKEKLRC